MLFDVRQNAVHTCVLCIKQFLTSSSIEFSDILQTLCFVLPSWCIKALKIVPDHVHSVAYATVFPLDIIISIFLNSASIFTAEIWTIIKSLEQIEDSVASKCIIFTEPLLCLQAYVL